MTGGTHSQGAFTAILFEPGASPHTFDSNSEIYEFLSHDIRKHGRIIGGKGIRGTRSRFKVRHREGAAFYHGTVHMYVSPADLVTLLPKMIGDSVSGTTFSLADELPYFGILTDNDYGTIEYTDCMVDQWVIRSRAPQFQEAGEPDMLYMSLSIVASNTASTSWPGTPPTLGTSAGYAPYAFQDCTGAVTINGSTRHIEEFTLAGNNFLYAKYTNALTPHSIRPRDRQIGLTCRVPWNSTNADLYDMSAAGAAASIAFTNGTVSTTFSFANMHVPAHGPAPERGKTQVDLLLEGICTATGTGNSSRELQITNDSTP